MFVRCSNWEDALPQIVVDVVLTKFSYLIDININFVIMFNSFLSLSLF